MPVGPQLLSSGGNAITAANDPNGNFQYQRHFQLLVTDLAGNSLDFSQLHCKFQVKRSSNQTPNVADIRVYNMDLTTANLLYQNLQPYTNKSLITSTKGQVIIQGGYDSNYGVIFKGNIKQIILGRESATDTFVDFNCGDGAFAYNYAIVNTTMAGGSSQATQLQQIAAPMKNMGTSLNPTMPAFQPKILPRGKTIWGTSKDYLRNIASQNGLIWSIQNGQIQFVPQNGYSPGVSVVLTSKTGMIGTPQQTNIGVNVVCLMNPLINPGQTIQINEKSIAKLKLDLGNPNDPANTAPPLNADGVYYALIIDQIGDNRGVDWYSKLTCLTVKPSGNPYNSVAGSYGVS